MSAEAYSAFEHRHRFAAWAAARAAQRGLRNGRVELLIKAIESSKIKRLLARDTISWPATREDVDDAHSHWCQAIWTYLKRQGVQASYGRAAKLLNVYLKAMLALGSYESSKLARWAHPPIDKGLLTALTKDAKLKRFHKGWKAAIWTRFTPQKYMEIIESFREAGLDQPSFWKIERYWFPSKE